jgi:hypothetical protein
VRVHHLARSRNVVDAGELHPLDVANHGDPVPARVHGRQSHTLPRKVRRLGTPLPSAIRKQQGMQAASAKRGRRVPTQERCRKPQSLMRDGFAEQSGS